MTPPGALVMEHRIITQADRTEYVRSLRERRAYYDGTGCRFWVFERRDEPGAFVEFTESRAFDVLASARSSDAQASAAAPILIEVELS
ncbi:MAG TPA: hypothetical protein VFG84_04440 [Gemmatimonadaceae bacterium]|nr:hypothetical protein [Gemmatimonadaceae bacterium]